MNAVAYDQDGNVIKCDKCDNEPMIVIYYVDRQGVNLCADHYPFPQYEAKIVYKDSLSSEFKKSDAPNICKEYWNIDLRKRDGR